MRIVHINIARGVDTLLKSLPTLMDGMEKVIGTSDQSNSFSEEINALLSGQHQLWIVFADDGSYQGFAITSIERGYANICWAYGKPGNNLFEECLIFFEDEARKSKLKGVSFYTSRDKALERKMAPKGYKAVVTQFIKEVM